MASNEKALEGIELISCAKASAAAGASAAADNCGYGEDIEQFQAALKSACSEMGVDVSDLSDLLTDQQQVRQEGGVEVAPDTMGSL